MLLLLLLLLLGVSLTLAEQPQTNSYTVHNGTFSIAWSFTSDGAIEVDLKISRGTKWVGFGIGEEGKLVWTAHAYTRQLSQHIHAC